MIIHSNVSKMKNKIPPSCLQETYRSTLGEWVVSENIRTPTTGGIEILPPPHAFRNSKMLHPPHTFFTPLSFGIPEVFSTPSEFPIQSTSPPQKSFFWPLKKMQCILNLSKLLRISQSINSSNMQSTCPTFLLMVSLNCYKMFFFRPSVH